MQSNNWNDMYQNVTVILRYQLDSRFPDSRLPGQYSNP